MASLTLIASWACAPTVLTRSNPRGLDVSGELLKYGEPETNLVSLSVKRQDQAPAWRAEFKDGTSADILAEDIPGLTILKWKVDPARMKTLTTDPFRLQISNGKATYDTTVSFRSAGRDVSGHALWQVVVRLVVGR